MPSDFRYSANFSEVYSLPLSVLNRFTCLPNSFFLRAFHSLNFSRASNLYFNMYWSICLMASSMKSSIYRSPPMAVSSRPHMSKCTSCSGSVAREVVGVKGYQANLHLMQLSQSHLPVIFGASTTTFGMISKAFRPRCGSWRCHNIRFPALCRNPCPVVLSASRYLSSISVYSVNSGARSRTRSRSKSSLTWGAVALNLPEWL